MIRLYGHLRGSFRTVSEGLKQAFSDLGVLSGYVIGEQQDFDSEPIPGATAPVAVVVGDPLRVLMPHRQGSHQEIWLMLAPNSEGIPPRVVNELMERRGDRPTVDGLLAPSVWAKEVLVRTFPGIPVRLCHHGVLSCFKRDDEVRQQAREREAFLVMHMTSTNLSRKGTEVLVGAWADVVHRIPNSRLVVAINPEFAEATRRVVEITGAGDSIAVINGQNLAFEQLSRALQLVDLVVQPSRAEGFGLVPLEARACGVPVVMTGCTGHADHVSTPGVVRVPHHELGESDDFWQAKAPTIRQLEVAESLLIAYQGYERLYQEATDNSRQIQEAWTWSKGAKSVVTEWMDKHG